MSFRRCETCKNFKIDTTYLKVARRFKDGSENGCPSCTVLWSALCFYKQIWSEPNLDEAVEIMPREDTSLLVFYRPIGHPEICLELFTDRGEFSTTTYLPRWSVSFRSVDTKR